jgi:uncharacterized protein (TIGR00369 family)
VTTPLDPDTFGPDSPCFGCAPHHPIGFHLRFERDEDSVVTRFVPEDRYQGPPGVMHGGLVTAFADELAAWTIIGLSERMGFTAALDARFLKPVRIGVQVEGRGRIVKPGARVVDVAVTLHQEGELAYRAKLTFAVLDARGAERVMGSALPDAWRRFAR